MRNGFAAVWYCSRYSTICCMFILNVFLTDRTITVRPRTTPISADAAAVTYMSIEEEHGDGDVEENDNKIVEARSSQPSLSSYSVIGYDSPVTKPLTINAGICAAASPRELPAFRDAFDSKREVTPTPVGNTTVNSDDRASMTSTDQQLQAPTHTSISQQGRSPTSPLLSSCSLTP